MRNLGMRVNCDNVLGIYFECNKRDDITHYFTDGIAVLKALMEIEDGATPTPSERRILDGFWHWFESCTRAALKEEIFSPPNAAYVYANLNTGRNVVFLACRDYEGGITSSNFSGDWLRATQRTRPEQFD